MPIDIDVFFHMNNSRYLQNAELSRWRTLPASNLASRVATKEGMMFLAVENNIKYIPIYVSKFHLVIMVNFNLEMVYPSSADLS